MKKKHLKFMAALCIAGIILIALYYGLSYRNITTENAELSLSIQLDKTEYGSDEPINIKVTLRNEGNDTVRINELTMEYSSLFFNITDNEDFKLVWNGSGVKYPGNSIILSPGQEVSIIVSLREHYNFSNTTSPYSITAKYQSFGYSNDDKETWVGRVYSDSITFRILSYT